MYDWLFVRDVPWAAPCTHEKFQPHVILASKQMFPLVCYTHGKVSHKTSKFRAAKFKSEPNAHQPNNRPNDRFGAHAVVHVFRPVIDNPPQYLSRSRTNVPDMANRRPVVIPVKPSRALLTGLTVQSFPLSLNSSVALTRGSLSRYCR